MYRCKISFGGKVKIERWLTADSILSTTVSGRKKRTGGKAPGAKKQKMTST
jgi:hypothetical protein